jgi:hypothetical protein
LDYLIGEKVFSFVRAAERDPDFASELPAFIAEIRRLFTAGRIRTYLDHLERTKFLAPEEPDWEIDDLDDEAEEGESKQYTTTYGTAHSSNEGDIRGTH